jgi:glycosyltransferase involved in cell wall biosynthesis
MYQNETMNQETALSIIVPAFNEEEVIKDFLLDLKNVVNKLEGGFEIIVVDDGSSDNTSSIAGGIADVNVIRHPYNKGNGAAVKTGIIAARGENIAVIDADGQHNPGHIPQMLELLDEYDLVVGARESFGVSKRGFGNAAVSKLASYLSGIDIPDLTCGFRAFQKEKMLEFIDLLPNGYSLPSTSTLAFATSGYNVKFIPINADKRKGGESNIKVSMDGIKFFVLIFRMVSLFKPLKIFTPVSISLFALSFLWSIRTILLTGGLSPTVTILFLGGIFTFLFGILADKIAEIRLSLSRINKYIIKGEDREDSLNE